MGMILGVGDKWNNLERMTAALTLSAAADTNHPAANLFGRIPSNPLICGSVATDWTIDANQDMTTNGGFESALGAEWTDRSVGASNTAVRSTAGADHSVGAAGLLCTLTTTGGSNLAGRSQDLLYVRAGETIYVRFDRRGDGTRLARARLQNLITGKYWSGTVWQTAAVDFDTRSTNSFATFGPSAIVVESMPAGQPELALMPLRLTLYVDGSSAGNVAFDAVAVWPGWTLASFHGHNLTPRVTVQIFRSTDGSSWTQQGSDITSFPQAFYYKAPAIVADQWLRIKILGTPYAATVLGHAGFGQHLELARASGYPEDLSREDPQTRVGARSYLEADHPTRTYTLTFQAASAAEYAAIVDQVWGASRGGHHPLVVVPISTETAVIYGRIEQVLKSKRTKRDSTGTTGDVWEEIEFRLTELDLQTLLP